MMTQSQFLAKQSPVQDESPSYDMKAVTKRNKAKLKMIRPRRDSNPGPLGQKSNALTTEPKSRLPDAVVRDWIYTEAMHDLLYADICNIVQSQTYCV